MAIKICFNNQIHRFSKLPSDLKALISVITTTFSDQLPKSWSIYYVDSDGDKITVSHDQSYQELVEAELKDASISVKIYVEASEAPIASHTSISDIKLTISQNQREKTAQADHNNQSDLYQQQSNEVEPRACPQPLDEGCVVDIDTNIIEKAVNKNKKQMIYKVLHLFKKLSHQDLSEEKKTELLTRLKEVEESLPAEERTIYEQKKEKWALRKLDPQAALEDKERKQRKLETKQLFRQLRNKDLSESGRAQVMSQLKELEEKFTPEQRERFLKRREKWQHKTSMRKQKKQFNIFKAFRMLKKIAETAEKGDVQKIGRIREKVSKRITDEEAKKVLEPVFDIMMSETTDKNTFGKLLDKAREQLLNIYHPQDKDTVVQEWQKLQEKHRQRREANKEGIEKRSEKEKKRGRCLEKFSPEVAEKALKMRETLTKGGMKRLCKFVAESPESLSAEELIIMYRTKLDQRSQRRATKELQA